MTNILWMSSFWNPTTSGNRTPDRSCTSNISSTAERNSSKPRTRPERRSTAATPHFNSPRRSASGTPSPAAGLAGAPPAGRVRLPEGGDVPGPAVDHAQAVEVAAILGDEGRDERRPPPGDEAVLGAERRQAREPRADEPQFVAGPPHLVN